MARYAREILSALSGLEQTRWQFRLVQPSYGRWLSRLWGHPQTTRIDSAIARYVRYPLSLRASAADLFHILDHGYGQLVRQLDPDRTVVTCHDLIPLLSADRRIPIDVPAGVVRTFRFRIREMSRATRVIAISEATRKCLLEYTDVEPSRVVVIPYGVNAHFRPCPRSEIDGVKVRYEIPSDANIVLQVATRGRYKNTPGLLRAFALLRNSFGSRVILVRVGAPLYDDEADLARCLRVSDAVRCVGPVCDDSILASWYQLATVLAFPSFWEGFGWPPLEAMASGTPVVASDIPAIREVVKGSAELVDPHDHAALAAALERVIADPAHAAELRSRGLSRAQELTWERTARQTLAVYDEVYRACEAGARGH
jgi:glycosyltransferase involved in cell wall biosynthesis